MISGCFKQVPKDEDAACGLHRAHSNACNQLTSPKLIQCLVHFHLYVIMLFLGLQLPCKMFSVSLEVGGELL